MEHGFGGDSVSGGLWSIGFEEDIPYLGGVFFLSFGGF